MGRSVIPSYKGIYAGVGSRQTPVEVLELCTLVADVLAAQGWLLRTGHAPGADQAFEKGAGTDAEVFLPWGNFESTVALKATTVHKTQTAEAKSLASGYSGNWDLHSDGVKKLMARNAHIILGAELQTPVRYVLAWTENGAGRGGTGQALSIARAHGIPVYDMGLPEVEQRVISMIERHKLGVE